MKLFWLVLIIVNLFLAYVNVGLYAQGDNWALARIFLAGAVVGLGIVSIASRGEPTLAEGEDEQEY